MTSPRRQLAGSNKPDPHYPSPASCFTSRKVSCPSFLLDAAERGVYPTAVRAQLARRLRPALATPVLAYCASKVWGWRRNCGRLVATDRTQPESVADELVECLLILRGGQVVPGLKGWSAALLPNGGEEDLCFGLSRKRKNERKPSDNNHRPLMRGPPEWRQTRSCRRRAKFSSSRVHRLTSQSAIPHRHTESRLPLAEMVQKSARNFLSAQQFSLRPYAGASVFSSLSMARPVCARKNACKRYEFQ